jgi:hypothetical protein
VRKHAIVAAVAIGALALGARPIASDDWRKANRFQAQLEGFQENPSISTTGVGHFGMRIDEDTQTIEFVLSFDNLEGAGTTPFVTDGVVTAAHIHVGARGVNGGVSPWLCGGGGKPACPTPSGTVTGVIVASDITGPATQGINPGEPTAFEELVRAIREGFTYVNVHTTRWPGGEIRGQIRARERDRD